MEGFPANGVLGVLAGVLVFMVCYFIMTLIRPKKISLFEKLPSTGEAEIKQIMEEYRLAESAYGKFYLRYIKPYFDKNPALLERLSHILGINLDTLEIQLKRAKMDSILSPEEILCMKLIGIIGAFIFISFGVLAGMNITFIAIGLIIYFLGGFLPQNIITQKIEKRRKQITRELPDFLDLLKSATEAGLSIYEAIEKVAKRTSGPVAEEFQSVIIETKARGGQWKQAMENMAFRNDIDTLTDVVSDILISYEKGTPITDTLAKEAQIMRDIRNTQIQEQARRLNVRMIIPMAIFSFLPLLYLLMAPMLIQMMNEF